ncbi:MAG: serine/threonine protein kinase [Planctomycetes bacterium]|nr:serine/threonine protein kinase [Planctomycetota bacterium]
MPHRAEGEPENADDLVDRLAAEFLERSARGEKLAVEAYLCRLTSPEQRSAFEELLRFGLAPESLLPAPIEPGSMLGPYRIEALLGSGGMGVVYRAYDTRLERRVAVKVLSPDRAGDEEAERRLVRESKLLARLQHAGIVAVHEAHVHGRTRYLVMDLVEGVSLETVIQRLRSTASPPRRAAELLRALDLGQAPGELPLLEARESYWKGVAQLITEVARAIDAAHSQGVLHRDINPRNVMVRAGGRPVVLDFGLGVLSQTNWSPELESWVGTPPYMAPEQLQRPNPVAGPRHDIYQIGLLLYELLTLRPAFPQDSLGNLRAHVRAGKFPAPRRVNRRIPRDLEAICTKAMHVDPALRYASAAAVAEDLGRFLEQRPLSLDARSRVRSLRYFVGRNRVLLALLALMLIAGAWVGLALRPSDWSLGIQPRLLRVDGVVTELPLEDPSSGDVIALLIESSEPGEVFALWVAGRSRDAWHAEYVAPVALGESRSRILSLEQGVNRVVVGGQFDTAKSRALAGGTGAWYEGVWLFHGRSVPRFCNGWLQSIHDLAEPEHNAGFIARERAFGLLDPSLIRRGPSEIDEHTRQALREWFASGGPKTSRPWRIDGLQDQCFLAKVKFDE